VQGLLINLHIQNYFLNFPLIKQTKNTLVLVVLGAFSLALIYSVSGNRLSVSTEFVMVSPDGNYKTATKVYNYTVDNTHPIIAITTNKTSAFLLTNTTFEPNHTKNMKVIDKPGLIKLTINSMTGAYVPLLKITLFTPLIAYQQSVVFNLQQKITACVKLS